MDIKLKIKKWNEERMARKVLMIEEKENKLKSLLGAEQYNENKQYLISDKVNKFIDGYEPILSSLTILAFTYLTGSALVCGYFAFFLLNSIGPNLKILPLKNVLLMFSASIVFVFIALISGNFAIKCYERNAIRYGKYAVILTKAIILFILIYFLKDTPLLELAKGVLGL